MQQIKRHWLTGQNIKVYSRMFLAIFVTMIFALVLRSKHMVDADGKPLGGDFVTYWAASKSALSGHAAAAYDAGKLFQLERLAVPASARVFAWFYPPTFFLVVFPLSLMPYPLAWCVFLLGSLGLYVVVLRSITKRPDAMWLLAGFSGVTINLINGQNGFLTAAIAGAAMVALPRRPLLAGIFIGMLSMKPQLGILFPIALIAVGAWRAFFSAFVTTIALSGLAVWLFGLQTMKAFVMSLGLAKMLLEQGGLPWQKMPTAFAFMRLCGVPIAAAYVVHGMVAVGAICAVAYVWRRSSDWQLRAAALLTGTLLLSPYLFDYDLVWLGLPIAWLTVIGLRDGWLRGEREVLVMAWLLPLLMAPLVAILTVQPAVLGIAALLWIVVRRTHRVGDASEHVEQNEPHAAAV